MFCWIFKGGIKSKIRLIIVDLGVGIPFNVRNKIDEISDIECIKWTIEKGNTTKDLTKYTGGLGLNSVLNFVNQHNVEGTIVYIDFDYTAIKSIDILFKRIKRDNNEWNF